MYPHTDKAALVYICWYDGYQYNRSDLTEVWLHTHVYVASIDVVTLAVIVTRNRSQSYTVVIICIKKGNINQSNHSM